MLFLFNSLHFHYIALQSHFLYQLALTESVKACAYCLKYGYLF